MKALGLIAVAAAPVALALWSVSRGRASIAASRGLLALVTHCERLIRDHLTPRDRLLEGFSDPALDACGFTGILRENYRDPARAFGDPAVCPADSEVFRRTGSFFSTLGRMDYAAQLEDCARCREDLTRLINEKNSAFVSGSRGALILGFAAGAAGILILI